MLVVLARPPVPANPREGTLHDPAPSNQLEASCRDLTGLAIRAGLLRLVPLHDLEDGLVVIVQERRETASIDRVGPHPLHPRQLRHRLRAEELFRPRRILHVRASDVLREDQPEGVYEDVALAPVDLLASVVTADPPFSAVFTD